MEEVTVTLNTNLGPRRRRKRPRAKEEEINDENNDNKNNRPISTVKSTSNSIPNLDDSELTFLDCDGDFVADRRHNGLTSVANLLRERSLGKWRGRQSTWQQTALKYQVKKPMDGCPRRQWRMYCRRSIPFTQLGTPHSEAVLAMDRNGSFVLSLGGKDLRDIPLALAIRFFGIPSRSAMGSSRGYIAPLLQTIPLLYEIDDDSDEVDTTLSFRREISPACTPVKILMSNDWRFGVAMVQPQNNWGDEDPIGTIILFSTPKGCQGHNEDNDISRVTTWQCTNVKMWAGSHFSYRNLLWQVDGVPIATDQERERTTNDTPRIYKVPATLFLNDEEDGFRLTWFSEYNLSSLKDGDFPISSPVLTAAVLPSSPIVSFEASWERFDSDRLDGSRILPIGKEPVGICVLSEAYLHVELVLRDVLSKREKMEKEMPTEFFYNLVSVTNGGRVAELIIVFIRTTRPGSLGLFVEVDLYTGQYQEENWVKSIHIRHPSALRLWGNTLALNRRMKSLRVGPYALDRDHMMDWSRLCSEMDRGFDPDENDDFVPTFWDGYVDGQGTMASRKPPKMISYSTLYPDCDFITNKSVADFKPVVSLQGKYSSTDLVYS